MELHLAFSLFILLWGSLQIWATLLLARVQGTPFLRDTAWVLESTSGFSTLDLAPEISTFQLKDGFLFSTLIWFMMSICCILVKHKLICLNYNDVLRQKAEGTLGKWKEPRVCASISTLCLFYILWIFFKWALI